MGVLVRLGRDYVGTGPLAHSVRRKAAPAYIVRHPNGYQLGFSQRCTFH